MTGECRPSRDCMVRFERIARLEEALPHVIETLDRIERTNAERLEERRQERAKEQDEWRAAFKDMADKVDRVSLRVHVGYAVVSAVVACFTWLGKDVILALFTHKGP